MICYKDRTFCSHYRDCAAAGTCPRPLTPEVQADAEKWWRDCEGGPPIATFVDKPPCHVKERDDAKV